MNKQWDTIFAWTNREFLMEYQSGRVKHIQWDLKGRDRLHFHNFIHEEKWFDFLHENNMVDRFNTLMLGGLESFTIILMETLSNVEEGVGDTSSI